MLADLVGTFRFRVEIGKLDVGGFSEVTGLEAELETYEYAEGGLNGYKHIFPKGQKFPKLVLKRGLIDYTLYKWYHDCATATSGLKPLRKDGAIILLDTDRKKALITWNFSGAYPVKFIGPQFKANGNDIAIEAVELVHRGLEMQQF